MRSPAKKANHRPYTGAITRKIIRELQHVSGPRLSVEIDVAAQSLEMMHVQNRAIRGVLEGRQ